MMWSIGSPSLSAGVVHTSNVSLSGWHSVLWERHKYHHKSPEVHSCVCTCGDALRSLITRVGCCTESSSVPVKFREIPPLEVWNADILYMVGYQSAECTVNLRRNGHPWNDWGEGGVSSESELHSSSSDISITDVHNNRTMQLKGETRCCQCRL